MTTAYTPPVPLVSDANTLACWPIDGPLVGSPNEADIGPHGWTLTPQFSAFVVVPGVDLGSTARLMNPNLSDSGAGMVGPTGTAGIVQPILLGEWSAEAMVWLYPNLVHTIFAFANGPGTGEANNNLLGLQMITNSTQTQMYAWWQSDNQVYHPTPAFDPFVNVAPNQWVHVLMRKKSAGGGLYDLTVWLNGVKLFDHPGLPNATGGTANANVFGVGKIADLSLYQLKGIVDRVKIYTVALSDAAILQRYKDSTWQPASAGFINFVSATPGSEYVDLKFDASLAALFSLAADPGQWVVTGPTAVTVTGLTLSAVDTVRVSLQGVRTGGSYTVTIPAVGIKSVDGNPFIGPYNQVFTGSGTAPALSAVQALNGHHLKVTFSKPVIVAEALNPANYGISPAIQLQTLTQLSATEFLLTTAQQDSGQSYTLTASNIHDLAGNSI